MNNPRDPYRIEALEQSIKEGPLEARLRLQAVVDMLDKTVAEAMVLDGSADVVFCALALVSGRFGHEHGMHL